jgi:hypothetical protein
MNQRNRRRFAIGAGHADEVEGVARPAVLFGRCLRDGGPAVVDHDLRNWLLHSPRDEGGHRSALHSIREIPMAVVHRAFHGAKQKTWFYPPGIVGDPRDG